MSPPWWTKAGPLAPLLGALFAPRRRPLWVLSLPRSGSSWVGATLGTAPGAVYLREPLNQLRLQRGEQGTLIEVDAESPPPEYEEALELVFAARPSFPPSTGVVQDESQWSLARRRRARVVVKDVNPHALPWVLTRGEVDVLLLVRHPGAVVRSFQRLGWWDDDQDPEQWRSRGEELACALRAAYEALEGRSGSQVVRYEDLCADPETQFADLAEWAKLGWGPEERERLRASTRGGDRGQPYQTARNTRAMPDAWRSEVAVPALAALREGWALGDLPWYTEDDEWRAR